MKKILHVLKNFWVKLLVVWLLGLLLCWLGAGWLQCGYEQMWQAMALVSAFALLWLVLRQYRRIREERSIEHLVQVEVDHSSRDPGDQRALAERLKHAIALIHGDRSSGGGGKSALSDLPWFLVIGASGAGKTALLTRSGISASITSNANTLSDGTQHCDWYFSSEAVLVDTAARYLDEDQAAQHFCGFLANLRKQRRRAAINGLMLVVSLPELLSASSSDRGRLAANLVARIGQYNQSLGSNPPIYLMLSKLDLLPGFAQAFGDLDLAARQQPMGMTFSLSELRSQSLPALMSQKFANLNRQLRQRVDARLFELGAAADSDLLNLPDYFSALPGVLTQFLEHFASPRPNGQPLLMRGLYFTSALQDGQQLSHVFEQEIRETFALQADTSAAGEREPQISSAERSFFITNTLREVIFPDRELAVLQQYDTDRSAVPTTLLSVAMAMGLVYGGWSLWSWHNNRQWLGETRQALAGLAQAAQAPGKPTGDQALETLRLQLSQIEQFHQDGVPWALGAGLYRGNELAAVTRAAYLQQLRTQALEPISKQLQVQLRDFNVFAQDMDAQSRKALPLKVSPAPAAGRSSLVQVFAAKSAAPITPIGSLPRNLGALANPLTGSVRNAARQASSDALAALRQAATTRHAADLSAATGGLSLSEDMLGRLNEQQVASIIEAYNRLKLYLILTEPSQHPDTDFVADALPQAWAQSVTVDQATLEHNTPLYLNLIKSGQAPSLPRNDKLVDETRQSLKSFMVSSSLADREYLRLQLESNRQFAPVALADLVPGAGLQALYGSATIPAMYTRQAWESFVQPQLLKTVSGNLQADTDWVLDGEGGDGLVQKASFMGDFMTRYKRDYAQAWTTFLGTVGVRRFSDMATATQRLTLLSDVQHSPLKNLLQAVNDNTQWDVPTPNLTNPGEPPAASAWYKALSRLGPASKVADSATVALGNALPAFDDGVLAERFDAVSRLFSAQNAEGAGSTVMDRYLAALRSLKVRLNNIQRSQDVGKSSKQLISETLQGQPTEVTVARNYVETSVDTSQDVLSRSLQGLFATPIQYTWETLRAPAGQQLAQAWAQQVAKPWEQVMAHRYPIAPNSANEASVKDLQRFVDPQSGVLPNFKRNEIGNLAGGEGLGMGSNPKAPALVDPGMVASIDKASALGEVIASLSDHENGFEIMLEPSANLTDIIFTLDGQVQHYRNGKTTWNRFTWPDSTSAPGARLDVITLSGERLTVFDFPGRWGLLKMSDSARVTDLDGVQQRLTWAAGNGVVSLLVRNYGGVKLTDLVNVKGLSTLNNSSTDASKR